MRNIKLTIEYDGTGYAGWQVQKNALTIQEVLEKGIENLINHDVSLTGSSRTDAGVHAKGMVANFKTTSNIPAENFPAAINGKLPNDIVILKAEDVGMEFHSRFDSLGKVYSYTILNRRYPPGLYRNYVAHVPIKLNVEGMKKACNFFIGTHDFSTFKSTGSSAKTSIRTIKSLYIENSGEIIKIYIEADGFLYNMVRIISGTLIEVGIGKIRYNDIPDIIDSKDRKRAGKTAPANGLCLECVRY
jgi:tRNA pseudouridine38-40 synthase